MDEEPEDKPPVIWIEDNQGRTLIMIRPDMMDLGFVDEIVALAHYHSLVVKDDDDNLIPPQDLD